MTQQPNVDQTLENPPKKPKTPLTRTEKIRDFSIGFIGWWLVNGLVWSVLSSDDVQNGDETVILRFSLLLLGVDIAQFITFIVLAFRRVWISLGILSALFINQITSIVLGLFNNVTCFIPFFIPID